MFLNFIKGDISIDIKKCLTIDFGDPIDKIHLKRPEGLKSYRVHRMTHVNVRMMFVFEIDIMYTFLCKIYIFVIESFY